MSEKDIQLIALDMDGTLLTTGHDVSKRTKEAIKQALDKNIQVVISTGRWIDTCHPYAMELQLQSYLITVNGGQIWTVDKTLKEQHLLDVKWIEKMWEIGASNDMRCWMVSTDRVWHDERPDNFADHEWLKTGFVTDNQPKLAALIETLSQNEALELTNSLPNNVEINPSGVNKASALESVCQWMGITMDNVMACGDSLNDIKMIEQAGVGVAMGNAQDAIKEVANYITDTNDQDGVAKAIEHFVL